MKTEPAINNGKERAYPSSNQHSGYVEGGLTKREYFAAMAMQAIISNRELQRAIREDNESWSQVAVREADSLLKQLEL